MARQRRTGFSPKIRNLRWTGASQAFLAQAAGTVAGTFISAASVTDTIMRIRGELLVFLDGVASPGQLVEVGVGVITMPGGQSTTVVQSPIADQDAPWLFFEKTTIGYEEGVTDVVAYEGITFARKVIDVKAMRILRPDMELQVVVENVTLGSASAVNAIINTRTLVGEH